MIEFIGIDHVGFSTNDLERTVAWYKQILDMEEHPGAMWTDRRDSITLGNGRACIALFQNSQRSDHSHDGDSYNRHFALAVSLKNFGIIQYRLREHKIEYEFLDHEISHSIYFNDPDGHRIEVTTYDF